MLKLEDIKTGMQVVGLVPDELATIIQAIPAGVDAFTVYYKTPSTPVAERVVFRAQEQELSVADSGLAWSFEAPSKEFSLALEATRISLAQHFDPMMAVHASNVEPLPHQISAVYDVMLKKQPLRFVLADDPGAGKTVMAGLLIKELILRSDARRVLIIAPGSLTEQWQDELRDKFELDFKLMSREAQGDSGSGNFFADENYIIARVDMLSRADDLQARLKAAPDWDLVIVDEAHKLSAHLEGREIRRTKRYALGEMIAAKTRHFLMMTATPHNGNENDFRVWMSLIDRDRFSGRVASVEPVDVSDLMRRLVKEELRRFDGTRLFPERKAYTVDYELSPAEKRLYEDVTDYVRNEMGRAESEIRSGRQKNCIGFALTMLQRRLASSPLAIYLSLKRRRERLEHLFETFDQVHQQSRMESSFDDENYDPDEDLTPEEQESEELEGILDSSTTAQTRNELAVEIEHLKRLEVDAKAVYDSGMDRKWTELKAIFDTDPRMKREDGSWRKVIIFTEHRDTLDYLVKRIGDYYGNPNAIVTISGATNRDMRRLAQQKFRQDKDIVVLVATDAAGEGVNLQNANLMVNYDLPWNPNRLEQRFGRIHRIGQKEMCHLWNLVAKETREGDVFRTLFRKLERERQTLGGRVFDILGEAFRGVKLKDLILAAIRETESPEARRWMTEVDRALDTDHLLQIMHSADCLVDDHMSPEELDKVRAEMDKAEARKLQPCYVRDFVREALISAGGEIRPHDGGRRFEIRHVPAEVRASRTLAATSRDTVLGRYQRICFDRKDEHVREGDIQADLVWAGHPLLVALTDWVLEHDKKFLKPGTVMVDPSDEGVEPSLLFLVDHTIREGFPRQDGKTDTVSRRLQFVRLASDGTLHQAGWAPHLDLECAGPETKEIVRQIKMQPWLSGNLEEKAVSFAISTLAREHYEEVSKVRESQVVKIRNAVYERLTSEINWYYTRENELQAQVNAGRQPTLQPANMHAYAEELTVRLNTRMAELERERTVVSGTPVVLGGILVLPKGLVNQVTGVGTFSTDAAARKVIEMKAMSAVFAVERRLGNNPVDVSAEKIGWDITSEVPPPAGDTVSPPSRHIEVKGRQKGATTVTVSRNEVYTAVNQGEKYILAICFIDGDTVDGPYYVKHPFDNEMDRNVVSQNYDLNSLIARAEKMA